MSELFSPSSVLRGLGAAAAKAAALARTIPDLSVVRWVTLRPHGGNLLTPSVVFWTLSARLVVALMAASEAVAWGFIGTLATQEWWRHMVGTAVGVAVFCVVWVIDVQLLAIDRAGPEHARTILGRDEGATRGTRAQVFGVVVRIAFVLTSLAVTAPFLSQLVFSRDIEEAMDSRATAALDDRRLALANDLEAERTRLEAQLAYTQARLEAEISGKGSSGTYGDGPTAREIRGDRDRLDEELAALGARRDATLEEFDGLATRWKDPEARAALEGKWGVALPEPTITGYADTVDELRDRGALGRVELAIKVYLGMMFAGILILKLYEPRSARLYFSEILQQQYTQYLAGSFDHLLPETERSNRVPNGMSPQRFEQFLVSTAAARARAESDEVQRKVRVAGERADAAADAERARREEEASKVEHARRMAELERMSALVNQQAAALREESDAISSRIDTYRRHMDTERERASTLLQSYHSLQAAISVVRRDCEKVSEALARLEREEDARRLDAVARAELGSQFRADFDRAQRKLDQLLGEEPRMSQLVQEARQKLGEIQAKVNEEEATLKDLRAKERKIRDQLYQ